jgi:hypothetical protein
MQATKRIKKNGIQGNVAFCSKLPTCSMICNFDKSSKLVSDSGKFILVNKLKLKRGSIEVITTIKINKTLFVL